MIRGSVIKGRRKKMSEKMFSEFISKSEIEGRGINIITDLGNNLRDEKKWC